MSRHILVALLITVVLLDVMKVIAADDDRPDAHLSVQATLLLSRYSCVLCLDYHLMGKTVELRLKRIKRIQNGGLTSSSWSTRQSHEAASHE